MDYLPSPEQQEWLVVALADLMRRRGTKPFVSMPLVEPTRRFFPDRWKKPIEALDRITRRLMQYADLSDLDVSLTTFDHRGDGEDGARHAAAALFLGLESRCAHFGYNQSAPGDVESIAGIMAHEVAHAYRAHHGLVQEDRDQEELLTDVTGAFLGFGLLLTNNSYQYRTGSDQMGNRSRHYWSERTVGYISPQAFAFLLAIQLEARAHSDSEIRRYLGQLEANQAAFVKAALDVVRAWPEETRRRLKFSGVGEEIEDVAPESLQRPLPNDMVLTPVSQDPRVEDSINFGRPVFRVPQNEIVRYGFLGTIGGAAIGISAGLALRSSYPLLAIGAGIFVGSFAGARRRYDICSDPECDHIIPPEVSLCPGCGGTVAGVIRYRSQRLEAQERYEEQKKARSGRAKKK